MTHLLAPFLSAVARHPGRPAVVDAGRVVTYRELADRAMRIVWALPPPTADPWLGAVYGGRGTDAYAAILATSWSGRGYVPLNPRNPVRRTVQQLALAEPDTLVVAGGVDRTLAEVLHAVVRPLRVVVIGGPVPPDHVAGPHRVIQVDPDQGPRSPRDPATPPGDVAYLLFTSGTTGSPKGVPVRHASVGAYLRSIQDRHGLGPADRVSQTFELTFDLSVHDLFACWGAGACLYPVPAPALAAPSSFIRAHGLTSWFCVPSLAARLDRLRLLRPGMLPTLRQSLFCGEPLPRRLAARWQATAPHSTVDNLYGPTEATIAFTGFRVGSDVDGPPDGDGVVPIGWPLAGQRTAVVDEVGGPVPEGEPGELCLAGSQVAHGYWREPVQTAERFVRLRGAGDVTWFRTGDQARAGDGGCLEYLGRRDDQVKIRGFRVELAEIDLTLRRASDTPDALALPWPSREAAEGVLAVVGRGCAVAADDILTACREVLPAVMVPSRVVVVDDLPRSVNGKLDRVRLAELVRGVRS